MKFVYKTPEDWRATRRILRSDESEIFVQAVHVQQLCNESSAVDPFHPNVVTVILAPGLEVWKESEECFR